MIFECHDLERALANPDLMAEAHKHMRECEACRNEYRIWSEISSAAKQLHCEWESPDLWANIRRRIEAERPTPKRWWTEWKTWAITAAAAAIILLATIRWPHAAVAVRGPEEKARVTPVSGQDFLTEQALQEVEKNEAAYRRSIEELSRLAQPKLESAGASSSARLGSYREKLLMLDSAIQETQWNVSQNQFNMRLQTELADLYREKRQTLEEILSHGQQN
jgi:hypothetical protein